MRKQELLVLRGLPGSGKSAVADAWRAADRAHREVVNRDLLRNALFDRFHGLTLGQEDLVTELQIELADLAIREGKSVVVDDTNLHPNDLARWEQFAADRGITCTVRVIDTPFEECLRRNRARAATGGRFVPEAAIEAMRERADANGVPLHA